MRNEFEKNRYWVGIYRTDVDFDEDLGEFGRYVSNGSRKVDADDLETFNERWETYANAWQYQQNKIDDLQNNFEIIVDIATELAEYTSYAEIVGGVQVNQVSIRKYCDKVFDFNKNVEYEED